MGPTYLKCFLLLKLYLEISGQATGIVFLVVERFLAAVKRERLKVITQATELLHLLQTLTEVLQPCRQTWLNFSQPSPRDSLPNAKRQKRFQGCQIGLTSANWATFDIRWRPIFSVDALKLLFGLFLKHLPLL